MFVVKKDPALTVKALIAHCRRELTGYKVPKHVYFRNELPKTNVGKILRRALKEELRAAAAAGGASSEGGADAEALPPASSGRDQAPVPASPALAASTPVPTPPPQ